MLSDDLFSYDTFYSYVKEFARKKHLRIAPLKDEDSKQLLTRLLKSQGILAIEYANYAVEMFTHRNYVILNRAVKPYHFHKFLHMRKTVAYQGVLYPEVKAQLNKTYQKIGAFLREVYIFFKTGESKSEKIQQIPRDTLIRLYGVYYNVYQQLESLPFIYTRRCGIPTPEYLKRYAV